MRILIRSHRDPFTATSARETFDENGIGNNVGNLVFSAAAHRLLSRQDNTVVAHNLKELPGGAARINDEFDTVVIPLANAFRPSFQSTLDRLSDLIEQLTVPVVVLGVGAQADSEDDLARLDPIGPSVKRFSRAVLDRSPSIGVRGEYTAEYLTQLGFSDVEVIGCPSLFLHGPDLRVEKRLSGLTPSSRLAINVSPYVDEMGAITMSTYARYRDLLYVAQDRRTLGLLLDGDKWGDVGKRSPLPLYATHPMFRHRKIRFPLDPWTWMRLMAERDFSFGTRIHGNIVALLAGTPAVVFTHDSRTLELARYHEIPYRAISDVPLDLDPADLYAEADFSAFNAGHAGRFARLLDFMERCGLPHAYADGTVDAGVAAFDARVATVSFPDPLRSNDLALRTKLFYKRSRRLAGRVARRTGLRRSR